MQEFLQHPLGDLTRIGRKGQFISVCTRRELPIPVGRKGIGEEKPLRKAGLTDLGQELPSGGSHEGSPQSWGHVHQGSLLTSD
jgi:hypothetical protein